MEKVKLVKADLIWDYCNMGKATRIQSQTQLQRGDQEGVYCQGVGGICGWKTTNGNIRGERIPVKLTYQFLLKAEQGDITCGWWRMRTQSDMEVSGCGGDQTDQMGR